VDVVYEYTTGGPLSTPETTSCTLNPGQDPTLATFAASGPVSYFYGFTGTANIKRAGATVQFPGGDGEITLDPATNQLTGHFTPAEGTTNVTLDGAIPVAAKVDFTEPGRPPVVGTAR
jgi:hypothetical protein